MHWVLWMVGTGRWDIATGVAFILAALPGYIAAQPLISEDVTWIVTWVPAFFKLLRLRLRVLYSLMNKDILR